MLFYDIQYKIFQSIYIFLKAADIFLKVLRLNKCFIEFLFFERFFFLFPAYFLQKTYTSLNMHLSNPDKYILFSLSYKYAFMFFYQYISYHRIFLFSFPLHLPFLSNLHYK